ncbi:hypothetical protein HQ545_02165 [Candidatus Woesearchaeota archaeon]|nr:hypothetical protein [Candidatus Woesearchaeota archaeon]
MESYDDTSTMDFFVPDTALVAMYDQQKRDSISTSLENKGIRVKKVGNPIAAISYLNSNEVHLFVAGEGHESVADYVESRTSSYGTLTLAVANEDHRADKRFKTEDDLHRFCISDEIIMEYTGNEDAQNSRRESDERISNIEMHLGLVNHL